MNKVLACLVAGAVAAPAMAANLNITIKSGGSASVNVAPGATVNFTIEGTLSSGADNEGLALIGGDLHFTGGGLAANTIVPPTCPDPSVIQTCATAMSAFVKDCGVTNPAGFKGTLMPNGDLVQWGGAMNTIKNDNDNQALPCYPNCAPFPIGNPLLHVAEPGPGNCGTTVLATGSVVAPNTPNQYKLQVINGFANVIKTGETLADPFLETEAAGIPFLPPPDATVHAQLIINVSADVCTGIASSVPSHCLVDARRTALGGDPPAITNTFIKSFAVTFDAGCDVSGAAVGDFSIACTPPGSCPTINNVNTVDQTVTVNLSSAIKVDAWTCITHTASGDQVCAGHIPGDANGNQATLPSDIIALVDHLNQLPGSALPNNQCDMDRTGVCLPADIITLIDLLIGNGFAVWNGQSLPALGACPVP
jgi:hypothetical protein